MAKRDYILCSVCDRKLIYDGYDVVRDRLELMFDGDPEGDEWAFKVYCRECSDDGSLKFVGVSDE